MLTVPVVDMRNSAVIASDPAALQAMDAACRDHGFFLLTGHGREQQVADMWLAAKTFFGSPREVRLSILRTDERPLGYYDRELTKRKRDQKEVFDFMRPCADKKGRNQWPEALPDFQIEMDRYYEAMSTLAAETLDLVSSGWRWSRELRLGWTNTCACRLPRESSEFMRVSRGSRGFLGDAEPPSESVQPRVSAMTRC